jgi:hypothetical protein
MELIDQVTWCSRAIRTSTAQKNADTIPCQDQDHRPPTSGGTSVDNATQVGKCREILTMSRSVSRSGAYLHWEVCSTSKSHPM